MKIRFLGTAAGGGLPQWNCACGPCNAARRIGIDRTQDCLAISGDAKAWYLVNASPDLRTQLLRTPELTPGPGMRETPLRGVLFTSAELDHTLGLLSLREGGELTVHATQTVLDALPWLPILDHYTKLTRHRLVCGEPLTLDGDLTVTPIALGGKQPRYASDRPAAADWVIGLRFTGGSGGSGRSLIYAPGLESFTTDIVDADVVVLDGTFLTANEFAARGHLPIQDSLPLLRSHPGPRYLYTHLNNTNPVGDADLAQTGAEVAPEAGLIEL
ncbi:coenzyme PQQ synthesis protein B [Rhizocola hellebori]|uniref:Coenzyme PQQ synthesis protein B n=1 Tax=Rhizocola hellebori TaxID=1392758 RepID=A0A8J3VHW7_9ACTN|nr:MBL fold metallo-hydrolase [Rhizocola hellebori]GIH06940.1 coenzyme PQQ synthesis protein B [Rhizocola hellebori]